MTTEQLDQGKVYDVYLAGGWFSPAQRLALDNAKAMLKAADKTFYDPETMCLCPEDAGLDFSAYVLAENRRQIEQCSSVLASIEGKDMGTVWEVGYALGIGKTVEYYVGTYQTGIDVDILRNLNFTTATQKSVFVCDTKGKNVAAVANAGYCAAKGIKVVYLATGLPPGAKFNLMLARSGAAVADSQQDLEYCLDCLAKDPSWSRPYTGGIE